MTLSQRLAIGQMCLVTGHSSDGRAWACAKPRGHTGNHAGLDHGTLVPFTRPEWLERLSARDNTGAVLHP